MDLQQIPDLKRIAQDLNSKFKIDILVNNGGTSMREEFFNLRLEMVTQMMKVNYLSTAALTRYIGKLSNNL
jgi:short-subunit dehydrogenase